MGVRLDEGPVGGHETWCDQKALSPGPDVQLAPVDDAGELKQDGEPASHPHPVLGRYIHVITGVVLEGLPRDMEEVETKEFKTKSSIFFHIV